MDFNWSRYIETPRTQDLESANVTRLIRTVTRHKISLSEVERHLSVSEPVSAQIRQPNSLDVINKIDAKHFNREYVLQIQ